MASWTLVPCLVALRNEFNQLAPGRDKGADGSIGDSNHTSTSDHTPDEDSDALRSKDTDTRNEVHALDIDSTGPWRRSFRSIVLVIVTGERAKWLDNDDVCRLEYVIFDRKIYSRSRNFVPVDYDGDDPHTNHAHFSARYLTEAENDTRPFFMEDDMPLTDADVEKIWTKRPWNSATPISAADAIQQGSRAPEVEARVTALADELDELAGTIIKLAGTVNELNSKVDILLNRP